jgi:hypothetical protein
MKKSFTIFFFATIFYLTLLVSCNKDDCGPFPNRFKVTNIELYNQKLKDPTITPTDYTFESFSPQDVLDEKEYYIEINLIKETYYAFKKTSKFFLQTNAYACSPVDPHSDETIFSLSVKANKDFDSQHPKDADLTDLFDVVIVDYYRNIIYNRMSLTDFIASKPTSKDKLFLVLNTPPANQDAFIFTVTYQTTLGGKENTFIKETQEVIIQPSL